MAKITRFGTISEIGGQINFDGFTIDPEGDDSISFHTSLGEYGGSLTCDPYKVADVILTGTIERLTTLREGIGKLIISNTAAVNLPVTVEALTFSQQEGDSLTPSSETDQSAGLSKYEKQT